MKKSLLAIISIVAVFVATMVATSACTWFVYQPKEPECLSDK